jgi:hypothetical protein
MANGKDERFNKWRRLDKNHPLIQELLQQREEAGFTPDYNSYNKVLDERLRQRPKGDENNQ